MINPLFALAVTGAISTINLYRQNRELRRQNAILDAHNEALVGVVDVASKMLVYYSEVLDRHNVPVDEFDLIAMNALVEEVQKRVP
jgi:hypothetical protein